jgi:hypothetical protein
MDGPVVPFRSFAGSALSSSSGMRSISARRASWSFREEISSAPDTMAPMTFGIRQTPSLRTKERMRSSSVSSSTTTKLVSSSRPMRFSSSATVRPRALRAQRRRVRSSRPAWLRFGWLMRVEALFSLVERQEVGVLPDAGEDPAVATSHE